jgi:predicted metal-dependent hydrolase
VDRVIARELIEQLNADAERIASHFGLRYASITAERANVTSRYGVCYSDGAIKIRLRHATTGRPLKYSSMVNTLCHELAHLRHFNHGPRFKTFYFEILDYARAIGIYRPGRPGSGERPKPPAPRPRTERAPEGPRQLTLFG